MKHLKRDETSAIFMMAVALGLVPTMLWASRPQPLAAALPSQFSSVVREAREEEVLTEMCREFEAVSTDIDARPAGAQREAQWQKITDQLDGKGLDAAETDAIVRAGKAELQQEWPCFVERGFLQGQPVWLVVGSRQQSTDMPLYVCGPSQSDIHNDQVQKYCTNVRVAVVDGVAPFRVLK